MTNSDNELRSIAVFCGSSMGANPAYKEAAALLGKTLAEQGIRLIYGGGTIGLMGECAKAAKEAGGKITGVIPKALDRPFVAAGTFEDELVVTESLHDRIARMFELSDALIALPGGVGTVDEFTEALAWIQLSYFFKPVGLVNTNGYWNGYIDFLRHAAEEEFVKKDFVDFIRINESPARLIESMREASPDELEAKHPW